MVNNLVLQIVHNHIVHTLSNTFCALSLSTGNSASYVKQSESLTAGMRYVFAKAEKMIEIVVLFTSEQFS